ncbi:MAG: site-specific DNA-methyltransferase [Byssovorax sp.]
MDTSANKPARARKPPTETPSAQVEASRARDFKRIAAALSKELELATERAAVVRGDSLQLLKRIPDASVSLILTDPPYHSTKKANIYGDKAFSEDREYLSWMRAFAAEWQRILRPNGALYLFCAAAMSAQLEVMLSEFLRPLSHITWTKPNEPGFDGWKGKMSKEALRRWYPHSERLLFLEQATAGRGRRSTLGQLLRETRLAAGLSGHQLTEMTGEYRAVNHGGAISNWETGRNIPSREQYQKLSNVLEATGRVGVMPAYEDVVRPFHMNGDLEYTDVWNFPSVRPYEGKHPAEKPLEMLRHIIEASTYPGDLVLDCFAGSGATAVAAMACNRRTVAIEIEGAWVQRIVERVARSTCSAL